MKRVLRIARISTAVDSVVFRIVEQSHREDEFTDNKRHPDEYRCPETGINLISCGMPQWESCDDTLFVRGSSRSSDNEDIWVSTPEFERIEIAVKNYNSDHGGIEPLKMDCLRDDLFVVE